MRMQSCLCSPRCPMAASFPGDGSMLGALVERSCLLGEPHHEHGTNGEVGATGASCSARRGSSYALGSIALR